MKMAENSLRHLSFHQTMVWDSCICTCEEHLGFDRFEINQVRDSPIVNLVLKTSYKANESSLVSPVG